MKSKSFTISERWAQVHCAQAKEPADLLVRGCRIVNVYSGEVHPGDIAVKDGIIVAIREKFDGAAAIAVDGGGRFAVPGLVFSHGLPESGPAPGSDEGQSGLEAGVTSLVRDLTAGECDDAKELPLRQWEATRLGLGPLSPAPALVRKLGEALFSLRSGFPTFLQPEQGHGSVADLLGGLRGAGVDASRLCLGRWNKEAGGMKAAVRLVLDFIKDAPGIGVSPAEACAMATLNPAIVFGLDHRIGSITPGRFADFWLTESLASPGSAEVFINGQPVLS